MAEFSFQSRSPSYQFQLQFWELLFLLGHYHENIQESKEHEIVFDCHTSVKTKITDKIKHEQNLLNTFYCNIIQYHL